VVQLAPSGPDLRPEAIHRLLLTAIYAARRTLVMSTPYFVPDDSILTALLTAALRGVDVTLIVPARNDSFLVRHASVASFDDLLTAGVRIARFNGGLLHTKSLTVDGELSFFGSVNLDMRSLWLNFEISLLVYDRDFTGRLFELQNEYIRNSDWLELDQWRCRPARSRFIANTCRLLSPLL
jgi:cardiolipin synthase